MPARPGRRLGTKAAVLGGLVVGSWLAAACSVSSGGAGERSGAEATAVGVAGTTTAPGPGTTGPGTSRRTGSTTPVTSSAAGSTSGPDGIGGPSTTTGRVCDALRPIPAGATTGSNLQTDADGDGRPDTVGTYRTVERDQWRLRVLFATGGGSELVLPVEPGPGVVAALGTAPLGPGDRPRPVLFVATASGASSRTIELFGVDGCELVALVDGRGATLGFVVGASVGHQEGLRCQAVGGRQAVTEVLSVADPAGGFSVTRRSFSTDGTHWNSAGPAVAEQSPTPPPEAGRILGCGDVVL